MHKIVTRTPRLKIVLGVVVVATGVGGWFAWQNYNAVPEEAAGLVRVRSYVAPQEGRASCLAIMPACGYCPGRVIDKQCYAEKSYADKYEHP